jgi:hypothetical protein
MNIRNRTQFALGMLLLIIAGWLLLSQIRPEWTTWLKLTFEWPLWIMLGGAALLFIGLLTGAPDMAIPACLVAGVGGILYYQNATGDWSSWYYMWTLFPGFTGIGKLLAALLSGTLKQEGRGAINAIFFSIVLFAIFASIFGGLKILGPYKDYILIILLFVLGLWLILRGLFSRH